MRAIAMAFLVLLLLVPALSSAGMFTPELKAEYSAEEHMEFGEEGGMAVKVYAAPGKERREIPGSGFIEITREDKGVVWTLNPSDSTYTEEKIRKAGDDEEDGSRVEVTDEGTEKVNGFKAKKYKMIIYENGEKVGGGYNWVTKEGIELKSDYVVKSEGEKARIKFEIRNLKIGRLDPALFEIPEGYEKMETSFLGFGGSRFGDDDDDADAEDDAADEKEGDEDEEGSGVGFGFKGLFKGVKDAVDTIR